MNFRVMYHILQNFSKHHFEFESFDIEGNIFYVRYHFDITFPTVITLIQVLSPGCSWLLNTISFSLHLSGSPCISTMHLKY